MGIVLILEVVPAGMISVMDVGEEGGVRLLRRL